jgi:hypothetical protein
LACNYSLNTVSIFDDDDNNGQTSKGISPLNSQDRVKLEEQDHSYQPFSCTSPHLLLFNSQLVKQIN